MKLFESLKKDIANKLGFNINLKYKNDDNNSIANSLSSFLRLNHNKFANSSNSYAQEKLV